MNHAIKNASPRQYRRVCLGWYPHLHVRYWLLGVCLFLLLAMPWIKNAALALVIAIAAGAPFRIPVLSPVLDCFTLMRMEKIYGPHMIALVLEWTLTAAPNERLKGVALACAAADAGLANEDISHTRVKGKP